MAFDTSIFRTQQVQPLQPMNALMQGLQVQGAMQGNALQKLQMGDVHAQRQLAIQKAEQAAAQQQKKNALYEGLRRGEKLDPAALLDAGVSREDIAFLANAGTLGMPEVARTVQGAGPDGRPVTQQRDKFGRLVGDIIPEAVKMQLENMGGQSVAVDPYALKPGQTLQRTMTPGERDSSARGWASERRQSAEAALPTFDAATGSWVDRKTRTVTPAVGPDGKPIAGKTVAATEDERKAAGWLAQADNAWKNMREVAFDANGNIKDAAKPGFNDALAAIPSLGLTGGIANTMRGAERQKFMQASSSLSEALLRAATGAGVNESEARQKIQELTPVFGEDPETTKQKFAAVPMYLQALKDRAGRAAPGGYTPPSVPTAGQNKAPALNTELFNAADAILNRGK